MSETPQMYCCLSFWFCLLISEFHTGASIVYYTIDQHCGNLHGYYTYSQITLHVCNMYGDLE